MRKRISAYMMMLCICLGLLIPDTVVWAAVGKTSLSVSSGSVNIGDTVTVTGKASGPAGEKVVATMTLSWDASVLEFVSSSVDSNGGGGSRLINGDSFTITLKAVGAGTSAVSLSATDGILFDTVEELSSMEGSSASVTVNNAAGSGAAGGGNTGGGNAGGSTSGGGAGAGSGAGNSGNTGGNTQGAPAESLSADNSLKSLTISPGSLSPAFAHNKTSYTATVGSDVTSVVVSAVPANEKAVVESVTGNQNLKEGVNNIKIVVKAENGVTATYTVKVTKQAGAAEEKPTEEQTKPQEPETEEPATEQPEAVVTVNGAAYEISEKFAAEDIPADFQENTINYHGMSYKGVSYTKGSLNLLWMTPQNPPEGQKAAGSFFVYDETRDTVYPFVRFANGENYVIALLAPVDAAIPEQYMQTSFSVDETHTITAYQQAAESESEIVSAFYIFYGVNHEGTENWYQYDSLEGTYQRLSTDFAGAGEVQTAELQELQEEYAALAEQYDDEKTFARTAMAVMGFVIAVLVVVIINLLLFRFRSKGAGELSEDDLWEDDDDSDFGDDEDFDETAKDADDLDVADEEDEDIDEAGEDLIDEEDWETDEAGETLAEDEEGAAGEEKERRPGKRQPQGKKDGGGEKARTSNHLEIIDFNDL